MSAPQRARGLDVFEYLDYRKFLLHFYRKRKKESSTFSYRAFARRAGLRSPNHLKRVIDGERNLSEEAAIRYAEVIGLQDDAAGYFSELVRFNQAKASRERSAAYRRLTQYRGYRTAHRLDSQHDRYHSEWYIPAVREMVGMPGFRAEPKWIASRLVPRISEKQAADALSVLSELGMIRQLPNGEVERSERVVSTGSIARGMHIVHYHRVMMEKAMESIDLVSYHERDLSAVTVCLPASAIAELKERIQAFRKEILALEAAHASGDRIVHVGVQLFPLAQNLKEP